MYGTLGRMQPKAGKRDELIAMMSAPPAGAAANGYRGSYLLKADEGDEVVVAVMYEDKDAYVAMVHDPATDENFGRIMELLDGEPSWTDGEWLEPGT
jgi:heme-degrading monooxygenase HmoA